MSANDSAVFVIRPTSPVDVPFLADIERSAAALFHDTDRRWVAEEPPTDAEDHLIAIAAGLHWVAIVDTRPVGFAFGEIDQGSLHIAEISVMRPYQRRGAGRLLIAAAEDASRERGLAWVTLTTYRDLAWNAPFYRRLGFVEPADMPRHLAESLREEAARGHDPALRCAMVKRLT